MFCRVTCHCQQQKNVEVLNKNCFFDYVADSNRMYVGLRVQCLTFLSNFTKFGVLDIFSQNSSLTDFTEVQWEAH